GSWTRIPSMSSSRFSSSTASTTVLVGAFSGSVISTDAMPICSQALCFIRTYIWEAGSVPAMTVARWGERAESSILSLRTASFRSAVFLPSRIVAIGNSSCSSFRVEREPARKCPDPGMDILYGSLVVDVLYHRGDPGAYQAHLGLFHAPRGDRRGPDPEAARDKRALGLVRDRVLVHGYAGPAERRLGFQAGDALGCQVEEHEVVVGAAGDEAEAVCQEGFGEDLCILDDLLIVFCERGPEGFL